MPPPARSHAGTSRNCATAIVRDRDFFAWTVEQAELLRRARARGSNLPLDWDGLIEEVEASGASEKRELTSDLARMLEQLAELAWSRASDPRRLWSASVREHRARVRALLADSPSLGRLVPARLRTAREIALPRIERSLSALPDGRPLPESCPSPPTRSSTPPGTPSRPADPAR